MAEKMLSEKLGEVEYDGLIAGVNPKKRVGPGVIAGPEAETTFVRGTVFAKSAKDGKLHILGTEASGGDTLTADCILIEDVTIFELCQRPFSEASGEPYLPRCTAGGG